MSISLDPYESYEPTGSRWLPKIPSQWELLDGKRIFKNRREASREDDDQLAASQQYGVIPQSLMMKVNDAKVMLALKGTSTFRHVEVDDFVISLRSFEGGIEHSAYVGCVSPAYTVLAAQKPIVSAYYKFLLKSGPFVAALQSSTDSLRDGKAISYSDFGSLKLPLPPPNEQEQIASFLDYETAKIDALFEKQQQLIALLGEKRQAVISHAVTKGLNPDAPMRDSGVEWLGEVPEHWTTSRIGWLCPYLSYGFTNPMPTTDEGPFMLTAADISFEGVLYDTARRTSQSAFDDLSGKSKPLAGDVLITKDGSLGRVTAYDGERPVCISQSVALLRPDKRRVDSTFLALALSGADYQSKMIFDAGGTTIKHIYISILAKMNFWLPGLREQREIVVAAARKTDRMDELIAAATSAADLLQERRTALISAAVTGKIDVRGWKRPSAAPKKETEI
ncbi:restriction endonuclease subunit S [Rosistilla oblonga]|uniref:restriction endonuclease subunit S n=1 Tax=Rosistilla oblonga TaxID=2527990 RepID=UPI003A96C2B0